MYINYEVILKIYELINRPPMYICMPNLKKNPTIPKVPNEIGLLLFKNLICSQNV